MSTPLTAGVPSGSSATFTMTRSSWDRWGCHSRSYIEPRMGCSNKNETVEAPL
jgi:hypothetical protein